MKKSLLLMMMCLCAFFAMAQKPQKTNFTYEVRNASTGALAPAGTSVSIDLKVYQGATLKGTDTHSGLTTNALGQVTVALKEDVTAWTLGATYMLKAVVTTSGYVILNSEVPLTIGTQRDSTSVANRYGTMIRLSRVATTGSYTDLTNRPDSALMAQMSSNNEEVLAKIQSDSTVLAERIFKDSTFLRNRVDSLRDTVLRKVKADSTFMHRYVDTTAAAIRLSMSSADSTLNRRITDLMGDGASGYTIRGLHDSLNLLTREAAIRDSVRGQINDSLHKHKVHLLLNGTVIDTFRLDQADSIPVDVNLREQTERFTATDTTTQFTLSHIPLKNFSIKLYINGVFICDKLEASSALTNVEGSNIVKYVKTNNGNYQLEADDRVQISYTYIAE